MVFKLALWGVAGLLLLPSLVSGDMRDQTKPVSSITENGETYDDQFNVGVFATSIVQDLTGLCARNPAICIQAVRLSDAAIMRAEHGFRIVYSMVIDHRERLNDAHS